MNRPLITIQCGNYSNHVGSHFWNLQESGFVYTTDSQNTARSASYPEEVLEVDNDILYREGLTLNKEVTFTPRLIAVDLKGSLGALPECGELYGKISIPKEDTLSNYWTGGHQIFREEPFVRNEFLSELGDNSENILSEKDVDICTDKDDDTEAGPSNESKLYNLEGSVNFWSDYLGARYHPQSVLLCENFQHKNKLQPFDAWGLGREAWSDSSNFGDRMEDRVRWYAEECDVLGGFQVISDYHDGFGGLSSSLMEMLGDEYSHKALLSFPTAPAMFPADLSSAAEGGARVAGAVLSLTRHLETSLVTPMSLSRDWWPLPGHVTQLPHLSYNPESDYSSSAVLALALDTATLQYRKKHGQLTAHDVAPGLVTNGRRVATIGLDLPMQMSHSPTEYFESSLVSHLTPLAPGHQSPVAPTQTQTSFPALLSVRGMKSSALFSKRSAQYKPCPDPVSYLESCVLNSFPGCRPLGSFVTKPVMTGKPFPHIFDKTVNTFGEISSEARPDNTGVTFTTALTSWSTGLAAQRSLQRLEERAAKLRLAKLYRLTETGLEAEEWEESIESLRRMIDNYHEEDNY